MQVKRKKICIFATVPFALVMFMRPHISMLAEQYDVTLAANGVEQDVASMLGRRVRFVHVNITRKISLWSDLVALILLYKLFRKERFDVVHTITPKAGLLGMLAAYSAGILHRIHTFTGQVWVNKTGMARWGLKALDKLLVKCTTGILADSLSQCKFLIAQQVVDKNRIDVLGNGSVCGVNVDRFRPNSEVRHAIRSNLGIPDNDIVYLFLGRLNKDKGIQDLAHAFSKLAANLPHIHLLVVGPDEDGMEVILQSTLGKCLARYHRVGYTSKPEDYMACADIFCLPSYREGFGSVIIEAAAVGVPAVASNIYGLEDAVVDGKTGILHRPNSIEDIERALITLTNDSSLREKMSKQAVARVNEFFATDILVLEMSHYYQNLLFK